jgi:hypothetical protein
MSNPALRVKLNWLAISPKSILRQTSLMLNSWFFTIRTTSSLKLASKILRSLRFLFIKCSPTNK